MIKYEAANDAVPKLDESPPDAKARTDAAFRLISSTENTARAAKTLRLKAARKEADDPPAAT